MLSSNCRRMEEERQKREKYLQRRVQETLCLQPPDLPTQASAHAKTYAPTSEQQKATARLYKSKLRVNRILQVRAQEALMASQRVSEFRDRKTNDSKKFLSHLKDVWRNDQRRRIASLEQEFAKSCKSIGVSHEAALLVERNRAAKEEFAARQAEESRCWDTLRFEEAMHKERELKELREREDCAPKLRRKLVESVSNIERSFARRYNHGAKPKPHEKQAYVVSCPEQEEVDAWRAADATRESIKCEKAHQIALERLHNERKLERGDAAAAKLLNDQRMAMLEHEVEEAFKHEEREKDRVQAAINPGVYKRATSAGQERRILYTKHKISNPLSCPGLPHTSLTCSRCRSFVELIPPPPKPVNEEPTPEFNTEYEPDAEPDFNISVQ